MKGKSVLFLLLVYLVNTGGSAIGQATDTLSSEKSRRGTFPVPTPRRDEVKHALEAESLVPMFFFGGWHFGVGYRYKKIRIRASLINGGNYNVDNQSVKGKIEGYERYYTTSPGIFAGYNVWKNLEVFGYFEYHDFDIKQLPSAERKTITSEDFGIGISYQFFIGRVFYIQPGIHSYFRGKNHTGFANGQTYNIPTTELSPVVRVGARLWRKD